MEKELMGMREEKTKAYKETRIRSHMLEMVSFHKVDFFVITMRMYQTNDQNC